MRGRQAREKMRLIGSPFDTNLSIFSSPQSWPNHCVNKAHNIISRCAANGYCEFCENYHDLHRYTVFHTKLSNIQAPSLACCCLVSFPFRCRVLRPHSVYLNSAGTFDLHFQIVSQKGNELQLLQCTVFDSSQLRNDEDSYPKADGSN